jgi:beta-lactamase regulating signal transducer with metallopeptidase domain
MSLTYSMRLVCICFASFFLIQAVFSQIVNIAARGAIRSVGRMRPGFASRFLFVMRMMPLSLAGFAVFGLCIPSYLSFEPNAGGEQVGWTCVALALLGAAVFFGSLARVALAASRSLQYGKACGKVGRQTILGRDAMHATIVPQSAPLLAVAGIFHSRLIVSADVLHALSPDELDAALRHERAHGIWRDNFKRLLFLAAPRGFMFSKGLRAIERQWSKYSEWAADDFAAAGDSQKALSLAEALVQIARLGRFAPQPAIVSSFVEGSDLSERVDRLLLVAPSPERFSGKMRVLMGGLTLVPAFFLAAAILWPASLSAVHFLLERLID